MHISPLATLCIICFVSACGTNGDGDPPNPVSGSGAPVSIGTAATQFGTILVGSMGHALYKKAGDSTTISTCTDSCVTAWPPLIVSPGQQAVGGPGVDGTFGTLDRSDGTIQATYNGMPLYYWQGDQHSGDATGNGIDGFTVVTP